MKLKFKKNENKEILVKINGKDFSTKDYIEMIKEINNEKKIEVEFGKNVTEEEQESVLSMFNDINNIKEVDHKECDGIVNHNEDLEGESKKDDDEIKVKNIPF